MRRSWRLRDEQSGSATTEGVIVATFLAIVFGASLWVGQLFVRALEIGRNVRAQIDGPSYLGSREGALDGQRLQFFDRAQSLADRWTPLRASERSTLRVDVTRATATVTVRRPGLLGGGSADLRWEDARQRNELPRAGPDENWDSLKDTWCRTGMCPEEPP